MTGRSRFDLPPSLRIANTLERYVAVVTGANRGIGREIVASIAETAAKASRAATIVLCSRTAAEGEKAAAEIQASLKLYVFDCPSTDWYW